MGFQNWISTTYFTLETKNLNLSTYIFIQAFFPLSMWICLPAFYYHLYCYGCALKIEKPVVVAETQIDFFSFSQNVCSIQFFFPKIVDFWTLLRKSSLLKIFTFFFYFRALCDTILYVLYRLVMCKECLIKIDLELIGAWDCLQYIHSNYSAPRNNSRGF